LVYFDATACAAEVDTEVKAFLDSLENAVNKMDTYRFITESENRKGDQSEEKVIMFQFKKPNLMRTDVLEGKKKGNSVVLNKEGKIIGRNRMGFKKTLQPTDKRLKNIRGYTFMDSSLLSKTARGCKATLRTEECLGRPSYRLHIEHHDADDDVTAEDLWFDKGTYMLMKNLKYANDEKVTGIIWRDVEINIPLDESLFEQ
jgi:outer membrane lipoprotein-sorting protein